MWTRVTGQPAFNGDLFNKCIKLDGVNDYMNIPNNDFYQLGNNAFSFVMRFNHLSAYTTKGFLRTAGNGSVPRLVIGAGGGSANALQVYFISQRHLNDGFLTGDRLDYNINSIPLYTWNTLIVIRRGNNISGSTDTVNFPNSIRNPNNIEVWVNGVKLTPTSIVQQYPEGLEYDVKSSENFTVGARANADGYFDGYIDFLAYYNKELSQEEITEASAGRFTDDQAKGIWNFNGNTNDDSSVNNPLSLLNSATPDYITWAKTSGLFVFKPSTTNQVFSRVFPASITITAVYKSQAYTYQYSLDGTNWQTLTSTAGNNTEINITVPGGSPLYIRDQSARMNVGIVHLTF